MPRHLPHLQLQGVRRVARVNSDLRLLADELGRGLYGELDYRAEAANAELFAVRLLALFSHVSPSSNI